MVTIFFLAAEKLIDGCSNVMVTFFCNKHTNGASMNVLLFDIKNTHTFLSRKHCDRFDADVAQMFEIDSIELVALDEVHHVWKF